ncbi:hypothetical protein L596_011983 [Steinernema carpocapsae]|uniref:STAS domain-containing protein n=1 Tax=Steinernema carpocapsae TaxID=34508 RepID=A0A4U5NWH6_STECR|nr:hypothetical protein L596_011983 [Steinernema carpocapsae]
MNQLSSNGAVATADPKRSQEMRVGDQAVGHPLSENPGGEELKRRYPETDKHFINQDEFDELFNFLPQPKIEEKGKKLRRKLFHPCTSFSNFQRFICSFFPILTWLKNYEWGSDLLGDMMAGITVGIVQVPQGIAYAILTGVDPVYGLYSSFFGVSFYMLFGTSHHVSIGSFAIISLMTGVSSDAILESIHTEHVGQEIKYLDKMHRMGDANTQLNFKNLTELVPQAVMADKLGVVATITFCVGLVHLIMALLRVEFLASYLSDQIVAGFSTGAAVQIVVVQLDKLFQVNMERFDGPGRVIRQLIDVCSNIADTNRAAAIISLCSFIFLYIGKDKLNPIIKKKIPVPLPFELILVIITTSVSYFANMKDNYGLRVVNNVPVGLPTAFLPRFHLIRYVFWDSIEIAFVIVAIHLSMCKIFNRKHGYKTDNNQELYALGFVATLSSLFNTYPVSSALGRSILNEECGARTQLAAAFTALLLLVVILFVGPLLASLPMCVLAAIIIYSMKSIFYSLTEVKKLWRIAKIDCSIWIVSFLATTFFNVMEGLAISVVYALLTTVFRIQWPRWRILSRLTGTEDYRDIGRYSRVSNIESIRVFRFDAPLLFTNVEHFRHSVEKATVDCPLPSLATLDNLLTTEYSEEKLEPKSPRRDTKQLLLNGANISDFEINCTAKPKTVEHLVIDCSGFTFVDYTSIQALQEVFLQMVTNGTRIYFAGAKAPVRDMFESCGLYKAIPRDNFYPTIYDAVEAAIARKKRRAERKKKAAAAYENSFTPPEHKKKNKNSVEDSKAGNAHVRIVIDGDQSSSSSD